MTTSDVLTLIFSGLVAASTAAYTYFSYRLWHATRASVDVARYSAVLNILMLLDSESRRASAEQRPEAKFMVDFGNLLTETALGSLLEEIDPSSDPKAREYLVRIRELASAHGIKLPASLADAGATSPPTKAP